MSVSSSGLPKSLAPASIHSLRHNREMDCFSSDDMMAALYVAVQFPRGMGSNKPVQECHQCEDSACEYKKMRQVAARLRIVPRTWAYSPRQERTQALTYSLVVCLHHGEDSSRLLYPPLVALGEARLKVLPELPHHLSSLLVQNGCHDSAIPTCSSPAISRASACSRGISKQGGRFSFATTTTTLAGTGRGTRNPNPSFCLVRQEADTSLVVRWSNACRHHSVCHARVRSFGPPCMGTFMKTRF